MQGEFIMAIGTFLSCCFTYLITVSCSYLKVKIAEAKREAESKSRELTKIGLETAESTIEAVAKATVGKLEQISGEKLKAAAKDGKIDKKEIYQLAEEAYREVIQTVSPEMMKLLQNGMQDVETYVKNEIERQVFALKHN